MSRSDTFLRGYQQAYIQAVKRNLDRFPSDFAFQLSADEWDSLKSQIVTSNLRSQFVISSWGGRRYAPYAFTEHGSLTLSSVLKSTKAVEISQMIVRTFVWLRKTLPAHQELASKVAELENAVGQHDESIKVIIQALQQMILPTDKDKRRIGF